MVSRKVKYLSQASVQEPAVYAVRKKDAIQILLFQLQDFVACFIMIQIFTFREAKRLHADFAQHFVFPFAFL